MTSRSLTPWALAALSGVLYFIGFIGFDQWYLSWIAFVPILLALRRVQGAKRAFLVAWVTGFVTHLGGYYWVVHLLQNFAQAPLPAAVLGYLVLCLYQGASFALFGLLAWKAHKRWRLPLAVTGPIALMASEQLYPLLFTNYLANSQAYVPPVTQIVEFGGPLLLSGLMVLVSGALAEVIAALLEKRPLPRKLPIVAALALGATLVYGPLRIRQLDARDAAAPQLKTAIIQGNVGEGDKHARISEGIAQYREMTDQAMEDPSVGLVVWPETAYMRLVQSGIDLTGSVATHVKVPMIVGALKGDPFDREQRLWNAAYPVSPGGETGISYNKIKILAFGEYIPFGDTFPWLYDYFPYTSHFERGAKTTPLSVGPWSFSANICYEDILPGLVRELMGPIDAGGTRPHALVNLTNDSWYGPVEPRIHLALSTFRSIEHRRWMVRATATGISAFIDSAGRVVSRSTFDAAETLTHEVPMITGGGTLYGVIGGYFEWGVALLALGLAFVPRGRQRSGRA